MKHIAPFTPPIWNILQEPQSEEEPAVPAAEKVKGLRLQKSSELRVAPARPRKKRQNRRLRRLQIPACLRLL